MIGPFGKSPKVSHHARAVVTGAGSGIGAAFAIELAKRGSRVVCSDIDEVAAKRTVTAISEFGGEAVAITCDVTQFDDVQNLAAQSQSWFGAAPTLVINNAGVGSGGAPIGELPLEDWQWVLGINLWGPIYGSHVFAPDPAGGRLRCPAGHHQRRLGGRVRRRTRHGRLQRQQGRSADAFGDSGGRIVRQRSQSHRALPHLRQDQHHRSRSHLGGRDEARRTESWG